MTIPLAYLNGRFLPFAEAALPLHDAGFVSGATVVDNARTFRHKLFRWTDHLERFRRDCATCYVPLETGDDQRTAIAEELLAHNAKLLPPGGELQLVTFATPGPLGFYLGEATNGPPTLGMVTYPLPFARYRPFFTDGVTLAMAGFQASDRADILDPMVKHRSRLFWYMAEQRLRDPDCQFYRPGDLPVVMNLDGVGDTSVGTILAVHGDRVITPEHSTVLDGISAKVVGELCDQIGLRFGDAPLDMRGLYGVQKVIDGDPTLKGVTEMLLTGTGFCLAGVRKFASKDASRSYAWPGPVFTKLLAAWSDLVGLDIAKQFTESA